jgi:2,4-dienoyl-CoA reductase-like NADH-dependent reductase (Old Yellow Enzyme family)/thioredoxin reductase
MNLIRSLMKRRQFLTAAGVTSTSALALNALGGSVNPVFQTNVANAAVKSATSALRGASDKYTHLFSPLKIGNAVLKSRMYFTHATPHFLQGPENYPSIPMRDFYIDLAKNGAAIITLRIIQNRVRKEQFGDSAHMIIYDFEDAGVQNYLDQMIEGMNMYGTKAAFDLSFSTGGGGMPQMQGMPGGARGAAPGGGTGAAGAGMPGGAPGGARGEEAAGGARGAGAAGMPQGGQRGGMPSMGGAPADTELSEEDLKKQIDTMLTQVEFYKNHGFGVAITRGGTSKSSIATFNALRKAWPDVLIMSRLSVGSTVEEAVAQAKKLEGLVDILTVQDSNASNSHCLSYNSEKNNPGTLKYVEALKKAGVKIAIAPNGGYTNLDKNEEYIATGKCDMIAMGRQFIADPEYARKAYEGRGDDVTPCVLCNKCHGVSFSGSWFTVCTVNPKVGIAQAVQKIEAPTSSKKVAVIGGGPAGMKAAITAAERGHKVTLYEKDSVLGGQLRHADFNPLKWSYKDFKDYLIRQVNKTGVQVLLNTAATPEMIKSKGYDAILVAAGTDFVAPKIPGAEGKNIYNVLSVGGKEKELGKNVVIIGGGAFSVDTGMYLAKAGKNVTILTSEKELMERGGPHQGEIVMELYRNLEGFSYVMEATANRIADGKVFYKDASGSEKSVPADSVVMNSGRKPRMEEALKYSGLATQFYIIGDCSGNCGNIQKSIRNAFFMASQV